MAYAQGGWYDNPATGKNQRWWNGAFLPVGQTDPGGGGSSGGGGGGGGGGGVDDIINNAISSLQGLFPKKVTPYDQVNPFSFDEELAKKASTAEYDPYYKELLSDYTTGVERTKSRSSTDLETTLKQLQQGKDYYMGTERSLLDKAVKNTNEGYAGRGLYFSGAKQSDLNDLQKQYGMDIQNYTDKYNYNTGQAETQNTRTQEDTDLAKSQYVRDTNRAEDTAIAGGVLQRKTEAQDQYEIARKKYYDAAQYGGA